MLQGSTSAPSGWHDSSTSLAEAPGTLSTVVYRSRASRPLSPAELHDLTLTAQVRNSRENITGLLLYDNGLFFQWLEGPPASINRLMRAIRQDTRHTDVQVLRDHSAQVREFAEWSLKLAASESDSELWRGEVIDPPRHILDGLRRRPDAAPAFLVGLVSLPGSEAYTGETDGGTDRPLQQKTATILKNLFMNAVIPMLGVADPSRIIGDASMQAHPRAAELADLLVAADGQAARDLFTELQQGAGAIGQMAAALLEPAARSLGDLWSEDLCSEFDVTLGLCRLQSAVRILTDSGAGAPVSRTPRPMVLIAPEPGELHRLAATLDNSVLRRAGWAPHCEFPADDNAMSDLVSTTWFDVLDLSLSSAMCREHNLPRLARTIAEARKASCNPALVVVVGGRVFLEQASAGAAVGADRANTTSLNLNRAILRTISETRTATTSVTETLQVVATPS